MPLQRRLPKRGFRRLQQNAARRAEFEAVNLKQLTTIANNVAIDPAVLAERGLVRPGRPVKILGDGVVTHPLTIRAQAFSRSARDKIVAAGGVAELIERPQELNA